jgi:hypothetical protein
MVWFRIEFSISFTTSDICSILTEKIGPEKKTFFSHRHIYVYIWIGSGKHSGESFSLPAHTPILNLIWFDSELNSLSPSPHPISSLSSRKKFDPKKKVSFDTAIYMYKYENVVGNIQERVFLYLRIPQYWILYGLIQNSILYLLHHIRYLFYSDGKNSAGKKKNFFTTLPYICMHMNR